MEKKTIFDIPPPQKIRVTEYDLDVYRCSNCGTEVGARHRDCPQTGDMGIYLLNYVTMLKYNLRGPVRGGAGIPHHQQQSQSEREGDQ